MGCSNAGVSPLLYIGQCPNLMGTSQCLNIPLETPIYSLVALSLGML